MATSWSKVFDKFLALIDDRTLCALAEEDMTELLSLFLNGGISLYFKNCTKDLTDIIEPEFFRESLTGDGSEHHFTVSQGVSGFVADSYEMYVELETVELTETTDYTYDDATKTFTIIVAPDNGDTGEAGYNFIGQFNETLTDEECWILAHSCICIWYTNKLYSLEKLKNRLSSKDWNSFSPANLLDKLITLNDKSLKQIQSLTVSYSYNNFLGFN